MPVCKECQTPYDAWQHFCLNCGAYLKEGPPPLLHCLECGTGVESLPAFDEVPASPAPEAPDYPPGVTFWKWLGGAAALLAVGAFFIWQFYRPPGQSPVQVAEPTVSRPEKTNKTAVEDGTQAKEAPTAVDRLQAEVAGILANIREANLKKNILLFMETLSGVYPQLDKKREEVIRTWKKFNFKDMAYSIDKVQEVEPNKAIAEVKWTTTSQNLATKNWRTTEFQYRIWLADELGQWKIRKIEQIAR